MEDRTKEYKATWLCLEKTCSGLYYLLSEHTNEAAAYNNALTLLPSYGVIYIAKLKQVNNNNQPYRKKDFAYISPVY